MTVFQLKKDSLIFPHPSLADDDGLLAVGGDLSPERIITAYVNGIFPWYSKDTPIMWWALNPRFVLFPENIHISKSMKKVLKREEFTITINRDFEQVIRECRYAPRTAQEGTWITEDMMKAYINLHKLEFAISVEAWKDGVICGGLYGVLVGRIFFGESMFSKTSNASKAAFITFSEKLLSLGCPLIDCQVHTPHLETLGAHHIPLKRFLDIIGKGVKLGQLRLDEFY